MSRALTPGLLASRRRVVEKTRELPVSGEILVARGDVVKGNDIIAQAELLGDLLILRLPERMGLETHEVLEGLKVQVGDEVVVGQVICEKSGLFGLLTTRFASPEAGTVEFIAHETAHVGLRLPSTKVKLDAFISGKVIDVKEGKSATLVGELCYVQGIFGVGGERQGPLHILNISPNRKLEPSNFSSRQRGCICIGGSSPTFEALLAATECKIAGLVCGSIDDRVLSQFLGYELGIALTGDEDIPFTLIITEGFGDIPISSRVLEAVDGLEGSAASMNGKTQVRAGAVRPELIVEPSRGAASSEVDKAELVLAVGARVRLLRSPYFGEFAEVTELPVKEEKIPTGAKTRVLRARLLSGEEVTIPRSNVELV